MFPDFKIISTVGKMVYPSLLWNFNTKDKTIYLTFDDGPVPDITPWVLQKLKDYNARATFFCIGENVSKNPSIFKMILKDYHKIGNHSHNHFNGWKTNSEDYIENVVKAEKVICNEGGLKNIYSSTLPEKKLFRPPYGKIKPSQIKALQKLNYQIVMWDVISGDYTQNKSPSSCLQTVLKSSKPGSIVVFHDSFKSFKNLQRILPDILKYYSEKGFEFKTL